jgi:hypothetical protein
MILALDPHVHRSYRQYSLYFFVAAHREYLPKRSVVRWQAKGPTGSRSKQSHLRTAWKRAVLFVPVIPRLALPLGAL